MTSAAPAPASRRRAQSARKSIVLEGKEEKKKSYFVFACSDLDAGLCTGCSGLQIEFWKSDLSSEHEANEEQEGQAEDAPRRRHGGLAIGEEALLVRKTWWRR